MSAWILTKEASPERAARGERTARKARGTVLECTRYDERTSRAGERVDSHNNGWDGQHEVPGGGRGLVDEQPNRPETLQARKWRYLNNGCAEFYKPCVSRKGSWRGMNDRKSERSDAELHEQLWQDLEDGPSHKNANISGATGPIRTILISTWRIRRGLQSFQKARGAARK
ncbi:hypothetical protein F5J12DRAFT_929615 [Pisolithus orientalis]|uniref:uncharacterized protein n=1 Tax=Pisolithus orientalis TaxID=936130 RepID=UPI0022249A1E|nr:uncharacterized protein F5J12DRAFT_929615 [Pisolithus orientalis]KAI5993102.1 hypothetical protein F5J12DRAFT_929615 [Pisolithus orientalis]